MEEVQLLKMPTEMPKDIVVSTDTLSTIFRAFTIMTCTKKWANKNTSSAYCSQEYFVVLTIERKSNSEDGSK